MNESKITQLFVRLSPSVMDDDTKHLQSDGVRLIYEVGQSDKLSSSTWDEPTSAGEMKLHQRKVRLQQSQVSVAAPVCLSTTNTISSTATYFFSLIHWKLQ